MTTAKCDAKLIAQPQFAADPSACQLASRTLFSVLPLLFDGAAFSAIEAHARLAIPTQAMKKKQARQPKPLTAAASGVVAMTPPA